MNFDALLELFSAEESGDGWLAPCPSHADSNPSLRIAVGDRAILFRCRAGCSTDDVLAAKGITFRDLPSVATIDASAHRARSTSTPASSEHVAALRVRLDGYVAALDSETLTYARDRFGLSDGDARALSLGRADDLGGGPRLVVPFLDAKGVARGFQARSLRQDARVRWLGAKSPEGESWSKIALFDRGDSTGHPEILITEGPGDGLTAYAAGFSALGVRGAGLASNPETIATIASAAHGRPVVVIGDADAAGDRFAREMAAGLARSGCSVRKVRPPIDGDDLTAWRARNPDTFTTALVEAVRDATDPGELVTRLEAWPDPAQTELAQAVRLRGRIQARDSDVRFTPEKGFLLLDVGVWDEDDLDAVRTYAQDAAADVWTEASDLLDLAEAEREAAEYALGAAQGEEAQQAATFRLSTAKRQVRKALGVQRFAKAANSSRGIDAVVRELRALRGVSCSLNDFDRHHDLLACRNGVVNLRTGELLEHDPALLLTRRLPVDFDADASAPRWERFLGEVFPEHPDLPAYLQRLIGYGITGETSEQAFAVHYGTGANGKTVFTDTLTEVFREITTTTPFSTFETKPSGGIPNDLAALKGARLVMASEGEQGRPMAESILKRVTGHDLISARFMRQEFFEFRPTFLLMLASNYKPAFRGQDEGLWRRVKLIPWERYFTPAERDHGLSGRLLAERAGIVAWAVAGAVAWYRDGLADPSVVRTGTAEYRETSDALTGFLPGVFVKEIDAITKGAVLWEQYLRWADDESLPQRERWTRKTFFSALEERGLEKRKRSSGIVFVGVRRARATDHVTDHDAPEPDDERADLARLAPSSDEAPSTGADVGDVY